MLAMSSDPLQDILNQLERVKRNGQGWEAKCPAHEDDKNSLNIGRGDDGKVLLKCFAGCTSSEIVGRLGMTMQDLFPPSTPYKNGNGLGKIVETYDYKAPDGTLLYQSVRFEPKDFRQRRPDDQGGWKWNLQDTERILYRFPELVDAGNRRVVFIVEGEKDVDRLMAAGLLATTNPQGAGKWREEYSDTLAGRKIAILPDNDEPGRKHARHIAQSLQGLAEWIKVVELPGLPSKGDVSDWLDAGHTVDELKGLVTASSVYVDDPDTVEPLDTVEHDTPPNDPDYVRRFVCMADVVAEPVNWLWEGFLARGKFALWEGDPGIGKTYALLAAGASITRGYPLPGMEPMEPANVMLLTVEDDLPDTIKTRLESLGADMTRFFAYDDILSFDDTGFAWLGAEIARLQPALVIVDPIMGYIPGNIDIYKPNQIRRITTPLRMLAKEYDCAMVGIRHLTKGQKDRAIYRGSGGMDFVGASRLVVLVGYDPDDREKRAIVQTKTNLGKPGRSVGYSIDPEGRFFWTGESNLTADKLLAVGNTEDDNSALSEAAEFIRECLNPYPQKASEVFKQAEQVGISVPTLKRAKRVVGVLTSRHGEKGTKQGTWWWALPNLTAHAQPEEEE